MIELVRDLRTINVLAKFENDPWKIMDVRVLTVIFHVQSWKMRKKIAKICHYNEFRGIPRTSWIVTQIAKFMGPTWGPPGSCRPQMGPMLASWTLLSGQYLYMIPLNLYIMQWLKTVQTNYIIWSSKDWLCHCAHVSLHVNHNLLTLC